MAPANAQVSKVLDDGKKEAYGTFGKIFVDKMIKLVGDGKAAVRMLNKIGELNLQYAKGKIGPKGWFAQMEKVVVDATANNPNMRGAVEGLMVETFPGVAGLVFVPKKRQLPPGKIRKAE